MKIRLALAGAFGLTLLLSAFLLVPGQSSAHAALALSPISVSFTYSPLDPSIYDTVTLIDTTQAPPSEPFAAYNWTFGDGKTGSGKETGHKYSNDGTYTVTDSVTTVLNRTASASKSVRVRTDDVAVTQVSAPMAARAGQRGQIVVSVTSQRYAESGVQVQLQKSGAGGFVPVTSQTQAVPAPGAAPTKFTFNYIFTDADNGLGLVVFRAIATIVGYRDAQPANNQRDSAATIMVEPTLYLPLIKKN